MQMPHFLSNVSIMFPPTSIIPEGHSHELTGLITTTSCARFLTPLVFGLCGLLLSFFPVCFRLHLSKRCQELVKPALEVGQIPLEICGCLFTPVSGGPS